MRHGPQQDLALDKRLANQPEFQIFQIAKPAVEQLCRCRGGGRAKIMHLGKPDADPAPCRVTRDATPVDAATNDEKFKISRVA